MIPTPQQAYELLQEYNQGEFHLKHGRIVGDVMRWFANELGYGQEADFWEVVGILHDLDFERWPEEHCIKSQELMREKGWMSPSSTPPPATATASPWTSPRSTRWKRCSLPPTSSPASSAPPP